MTSNQFGENESTQFRSLLEHVTAQPLESNGQRKSSLPTQGESVFS